MTSSTRHSKTNPLVSASFDGDQVHVEDGGRLDQFINLFKRYLFERLHEKFELLQSPYSSIEEKLDISIWLLRNGMFCDHS